jgi:hypothetical protein
VDATTVLITVYCLIDDWLAGQRLRQRTLADSEVLTHPVCRGVTGRRHRQGPVRALRRHDRDWFQALGRVHRTTVTRQAANLWAIKHRLRQNLLLQVECDPRVCLVDSVAVPICRFARADRCRRLRELAAWVTMRSPSRLTLACAPICGCAGQG